MDEERGKARRRRSGTEQRMWVDALFTWFFALVLVVMIIYGTNTVYDDLLNAASRAYDDFRAFHRYHDCISFARAHPEFDDVHRELRRCWDAYPPIEMET